MRYSESSLVVKLVKQSLPSGYLILEYPGEFIDALVKMSNSVFHLAVEIKTDFLRLSRCIIILAAVCPI